MKFLKEQGFTLVELMVVVAIIGILSAVAIPNFKKYQAKSKTSEAKLQLASIYSAETSMQGDYDSFATCLKDAGYVGPQAGNYYAVGFAAAEKVSAAAVLANGGACSSTAGFGWSANKKVGNTSTVFGDLASFTNVTIKAQHGGALTAIAVTTTGDEFIAGAIGYVSADKASAIGEADMWWINENKVLFQENRGY